MHGTPTMQIIWGYTDTFLKGRDFSLVTEDGTRVVVEHPDGVEIDFEPPAETESAGAAVGAIERGKLVVVAGVVLERRFSDDGAYRHVAIERPSRVRAHEIAVGQLAYRRVAESFQMRVIAQDEYVDPFEDIDSIAVPLFTSDDADEDRDKSVGALTATDITAAALHAYPGLFLPFLCLLFFAGLAALTVRIWDFPRADLALVQVATYCFACLVGFIALCPQVRPPPLFVRHEPMERITTAPYLPLALNAALPAGPLFIELDAGLLPTLLIVACTLALTWLYLKSQVQRLARTASYAEEMLFALPRRAVSRSLSDDSVDEITGVWWGTVIDPTPALVGAEPVALARTHDTAIREQRDSDGERDSSLEYATHVRQEWSRFQTRDTFLVDTGDGVIEVEPTEVAWTSTYAIRARVLKPEELMRSGDTEPFRHCAIPVGGRVLVAGRVRREQRVAEWQLHGVDEKRPLVVGSGPDGVPELYMRQALRRRRLTVSALYLAAAAHVIAVGGLLVRAIVLAS